VSFVIDRWKLMFQESVHGTWMSGLKNQPPSPKDALIGKDGQTP